MIAPNWLGDLVMSTVLFERLARIDGLEVTVVVRRAWRSLLETDDRIHGLVEYEREGRHRGFLGTATLARTVRSLEADACLVVPPSFRAAAVAALSGTPRRIGWSGEGRSFLLTDAVPRRVRGRRHFCDEVDDLASALFGHDESASVLPRLAAAGSWPASGHVRGPGTVALAVGATYGDAKSWPPELAAGFAAAQAALGRRVLVLGDAAARSHADRLGKELAGGWTDPADASPGVVDLVGRTGLREVAAILRDADLFVGNDSGLMHLSASLGTPTLGLFGSTNPDWTRPRGPRVAHVAVEGYDCSPCHLRECPRDDFCLASLSPERVARAAEDLLEDA